MDDAMDWKIYQGDGKRDPARLKGLPAPPPWRLFDHLSKTRAETFQPPDGVVEVVNAALYLRRPVLVTGSPGTGKSSLAYAVAHELGLGQVLAWPINSRSTVTDGLYHYDALGRLREASLERARYTEGESPSPSEDIGRYVKLGPLGTAFLARRRPRVVLIDEIDNSDIDLPNDLLHVLENGQFEIPELVRAADSKPSVRVWCSEPRQKGRKAEVKQVEVKLGLVQCGEFPFIVITSNGERDLPPAFLRRCLRLDIPTPSKDQLREIVRKHLPAADQEQLQEILIRFVAQRDQGAMLAVDQLLNSFFLVTRGSSMSTEEKALLERILLRELGAR